MKLKRDFYKRSAETVARDLLGKFLVHNSPDGVMSGMVTEVEAYPAFADNVSHANKRTSRTQVIWGEAGFAYVYLIYGMHYQFSAVVNDTGVPEVVFIRAVVPADGVDLLQRNYGRKVREDQLTNSPGKLCRSFGIDKTFYGLDLTGDKLYFEDRGTDLEKYTIAKTARVGINSNLAGSTDELRFILKQIPAVSK